MVNIVIYCNYYFSVSGGSKRKLDFDDGSRTLKNKTFFLDLKGYRNQDQLERELTRRGGLVRVCVWCVSGWVGVVSVCVCVVDGI